MASEPELSGQGLTLTGLIKLGPPPDAGFLVHETAQSAAEKFRRIIAQHLGQAFIGKGEPSLIIQDEDPFPCHLHDGAVFLFGGLKLQLQAAALSNVLAVFESLNDVPVGIFHRIGVYKLE
jgi:hypothetical protein